MTALPTHTTVMRPNGLLKIQRADGSPLCAAPPDADSPTALSGPPTPVDTWAGALADKHQRDAALSARWPGDYYRRKHQEEEAARKARAAALVAALVAALPGERLAARRRAQGLSQQQLAAALGVSRGAVAGVETDRRPFPEVRVRMAALLGHPLTDQEDAA